MYYVGVDLHKETSWFYIVDSRGKKYDGENIQNKPGGVQRVTHPDQGFLGIIPHLHEGMLVRLIPSPLASICPRKSLVPCCVQLVITNLWLYGQPFVARSIGGLC